MVSEWFWMILSDSILSLHDSWMILEWFWLYLQVSPYLQRNWLILVFQQTVFSATYDVCCPIFAGHWRAAKASVLWWLPGGRPGIPQFCHQSLPWLRQALTSFAGCESWSHADMIYVELKRLKRTSFVRKNVPWNDSSWIVRIAWKVFCMCSSWPPRTDDKLLAAKLHIAGKLLLHGSHAWTGGPDKCGALQVFK